MKSLFEDVAFVVYPVSDLQKARSFYRDTLGLDETANWDDVWLEYDIGHGTLAITNTFPHLVPGTNGAIAAIEVTDLDAVGSALKEKAIAWATGPFDTPACRGGSIKDPDGNELILHYRKDKQA
ncbi:MAG: VOC family protein [Candidatus Latescibacteria bacterium]|jgi:catechol 2,3-dioxygenase-like lactoylglutathione lyase family enzyme|nr:VOC family protein [Candidatus Latescibacterota bacterium]